MHRPKFIFGRISACFITSGYEADECTILAVIAKDVLYWNTCSYNNFSAVVGCFSRNSELAMTRNHEWTSELLVSLSIEIHSYSEVL